jgi:hypothetical protein
VLDQIMCRWFIQYSARCKMILHASGLEQNTDARTLFSLNGERA